MDNKLSWILLATSQAMFVVNAERASEPCDLGSDRALLLQYSPSGHCASLSPSLSVCTQRCSLLTPWPKF